ncbi:MAG TPA: prepilin-type N-terminal cleavage/methylation domain-containing protein [Pseudobacteroides sp.]|uniref:type II secretion system protein n=1 Tax=Pseudobacteroides sp. TaxID=1968840 RepID=UPI002F92606C
MIKKLIRNRKGFTLTELIVVVAILGVLAAVVTPSIMGYLSDAQTKADSANLATIDSCVKRLAASGKINLTGALNTNKTDILNAIKVEIQTIPTPNHTTNTKWILNKSSDGKSIWVTQGASITESADQIMLN